MALVAIVAAIAILVTLGARPSGRDGPSRSAAGSASPAGSVPHPSGSAADGIVGLVSLTELRDRAARARAGSEPEATAVRDLVDWARKAVDDKPRPKQRLNIGGTTGAFVDDTATAYGLALAWAVTGDAADAQASRDIVMAWVTTTTELANACPDRGDCQTSLIVSRNAPGFVFAVELLGASGALSAADRAAFDGWLRDLILPAASTRTNNWGDAGAFLRVAATAHLDDGAGWDAAIAFWRGQIDLIAADGSIPEEVRRGSSGLSYTQEALLYKAAVARMAERQGVDLWSATGENGGSLRGALDFAAAALRDPSSWPEGRVDRPDAAPLWELVEQHWPEPAFAALVREARPFGADGHSAVRWTTLTNGVSLQP